ncbi:DUF975 family protein [Paenibacillaceae bacterium WGS1546]|uniref:DUF975 family protein n=1 Tax=Cohnella sp. WGS1546 TaxID=3366810 RepID=UPI00372D6A1F
MPVQKFAREQGTLFSGFSDFFKPFLLYLLLIVFVSLWSLLFVIPGIIAAFRYSQAYYILIDNTGIGPLEAIRRSKAMMVGHKGRFFMLYLSFIGWALLGCFCGWRHTCIRLWPISTWI